jgi:hypothetical protein
VRFGGGAFAVLTTGSSCHQKPIASDLTIAFPYYPFQNQRAF